MLADLCEEDIEEFYSTVMPIVNQNFGLENERQNQACFLFGVLLSNLESSTNTYVDLAEINSKFNEMVKYALNLKVLINFFYVFLPKLNLFNLLILITTGRKKKKFSCAINQY